MSMANVTVHRANAVAALLFVYASLVGAQQPGDPPAAAAARQAPPTAEMIARWVSELDSDVFDSRENATLKLVEAGMPAVAPLKKVLLESASLEVTARAMHVLRELGLSADLDTQDTARTALEDLAREPTSIGRRAAGAIAWLNEQRSSQTIDALEKLGAVVSKTQISTELGEIEDIDGIQINDAWHGTERDFRRLKWLQDVDRLVLVGDKIGDSVLPHVAAMSGLKRLHLYRTKVTERGLAAVGSISSLTEFGLYYSPVGDAAIEPLKGLKSLASVRLYGTKVTPEAKEQLATALALERIDYRRGAFLGVSCQTIGDSCELARVHEGSPAYKAGLRPGDVLVTFAGKKVADFDGLTDVISQFAVNDVVEVEFLRRVVDDAGNDGGEKAMTTKVTLGEWEVDLVQGQLRP